MAPVGCNQPHRGSAADIPWQKQANLHPGTRDFAWVNVGLCSCAHTQHCSAAGDHSVGVWKENAAH